jgi:4-hydroxy-tetrahydrodipicolinate reductase
MGATVCTAVRNHPELELVAAVDPAAAGREVEGIEIASTLQALADADVEVLVDFTTVEAARVTLNWAALHGVHAVVGTTGFTPEDRERLSALFTRSRCLIAANFAIGAVLLMRFAELASPWFDTAEVIELHHDAKIDAPSGTAMATVDKMAAASSDWAPDPTRTQTLPGARGAAGPAGIRIHSVRMRGMLAHEEVILGAAGQTLTLRHDSYDRESFMPGVTLACTRVGSLSDPLTMGIDSLLGV